MVELKYFICGLNKLTVSKDLYNYFKIYNRLIDFIVIEKNANKKNKIGFITFETENQKLLNKLILNEKHKIKGNTINIIKAKQFIQKKELIFNKKLINEKLFIGGLPPSKDLNKTLFNYFSKYGNIKRLSIKVQKSNSKQYIKRFAFLEFNNKESTIKVLKDYKIHKIFQKWIEVKPYNLESDSKETTLNHTYNKHINPKILKRSNSLNLKKLTLFKLNSDFTLLKNFDKSNCKNNQNSLIILNKIVSNIINRLVK